MGYRDRTMRNRFMQGLRFGLAGLVFSGASSLALPVDPAHLASELKMNPQTIRVKLSDLGRVLTIRGTALALSLAKKPELGNVQANEWLIDCKRSLIFEPATQKARQIPRSGILIESISGVLSVNEKHFREQLVVYPKELLSPYDESIRKNAECLVVNHLQIEKYLEGVVNSEFNSQWAEPAVEAQIIAARTYALYQMHEMRKDKGRVYDVESTQKDQVYAGMDRADSKASELVQKTRGLIMTPRGSASNDPIKAFYHASCGGRTLSPEKVWGTPFKGFTRGVRCGFCNNAPSSNWDLKLSFHDIESRIWRGIERDSPNRRFFPKAYLQNPERWVLSDVKADVDGALAIRMPAEALTSEARERIQKNGATGGHVRELVFSFADRNNLKNKIKVAMNAYAARNWIDPARLKSTWFQIATLGRSVLFRGKGSGHGVGMCQWGAKSMGEKGFTRDEILKHYYPGVKIARISL